MIFFTIDFLLRQLSFAISLKASALQLLSQYHPVIQCQNN